jgi:hypothetical protein
MAKRVRLFAALLEPADAESKRAVAQTLVRGEATSEEMHEVLCKALVPTSRVWSWDRDPDERALEEAERVGWESVLREERSAQKDFNVFSTPETCRVCGVFGLHVTERQMRRADEPATLVWNCPNGHFGARNG